MTERLQKFLAEAGLGSRRRCEDLIRSGRVAIDGRPAHLGASVDSDTQRVELDGHQVVRETKEYWLLNKPAGILSATVDPRGRSTVVDCVPAQVRVFPVGRLDLNSTGLLVLTNDGELTARLLHPRYHVEKEYLVTVRGVVDGAALALLRRGIALDDGQTAPATVKVVGSDRSPRGTILSTLRVIIHEGRKRQVRRMLEAVGHRVVALHRSRFDGLTDAGLAPGQVRPLSAAEVERLRRAPTER
ncbi:MAG: pseudouridine synthase [bacterium]